MLGLVLGKIRVICEVINAARKSPLPNSTQFNLFNNDVQVRQEACIIRGHYNKQCLV